MTALRAVLAVLWLLLAASPVHAAAAPAADHPCRVDAAPHHGKSVPMPTDGAMPCCSQPALPAPATTAPILVRVTRPANLRPAALPAPAGLSPETSPRPPNLL